MTFVASGTNAMAAHPHSPVRARYAGIMRLLGTARPAQRRPRTPLDAHEMINEGLPGSSVKHLQSRLPMLRDPRLLHKVSGMSLRTSQRKADPAKHLNPSQSGRLWKFAEIFVWTTELLGSEDAAANWLVTRNVSLDQQAPIDLLSTPAGVEMIEDLLTRIEYGVYA